MDMKVKKPEKNWKEGIETIMEMGKYLAGVRPNLTRPQMADMARAELGIDISTVDKVIKISHHPILSNPENYNKLPQGWGTLYELRFLPENVLVENMNAGKLRHATKYDIWMLRGVKLEARNKAGSGATVKVANGASLVQYVKDGMAHLTDDVSANAINERAKELHLGIETFRMIRAMVLLADRPELNADERKLVTGLLEKVDRTRNVRTYYQDARPLVDKIWGSERNKSLTEKKSKKRVEHFRKAIIIFRDMSDRILEMEQPYMTVEDTDTNIIDLVEIRKNVSKLAESLRRSKND